MELFNMLTERQKIDLKIIQDTSNWDSVVFAMVKRNSCSLPECAFLVKGLGPKLYCKNMFELEPGYLMDQLVGVTTIEFENFETMVESGWEVD
jgi:hypothetical protein